MKIHEIKREQIIAQSIEDVFAFFERPENLATITPPELGFEILTPSPISMHQGALIDYSVRAVPGMRARWTTMIADYDPPYRFVDVQLKGPYSFWHHTHSFESVPHGTLIKDQVRYVMPFGALGDIANFLWVKRQLRNIFQYRSEVIEKHFSVSMPETKSLVLNSR